jgi:hydroxymethylbilane synthase
MSKSTFSRKIIIGSRGSDLALWQAHHILGLLQGQGLQGEIKIIKTQGDKIQHLSFDKLEGKGFFTKELEDALLSKEVDIAVHSHKDLPTTLPDGLCIAAVSKREKPNDLLLIAKHAVDTKQKFSLKKSAKVGTSSFRRKALLKAWRDDVEVVDLRGNVPTRINKLRDGDYDAIILAQAGVERLNLDLNDLHTESVSLREFIPAPAQGVLAIEARSADEDLLQALRFLNDARVEQEIKVERTVLSMLEGGCHLPLGVYTRQEKNDEDETELHSHVFWAKDASSAPVFLSFTGTEADKLITQIHHSIQSVKAQTVFLTRFCPRDSFLFKRLVDLGFTVTGKPMINMTGIPFAELPQTDWVFFSSKHAVKFFLEQTTIPKGVKIGAIAKSTADELRRKGYRCDFIGYSTNTELTGKQFASTAGKASVLFPIASDSLRTIQKQFNRKEGIIDLVVYKTELLSEEVSPADIVVFTSPSNAEAYLSLNPWQSHQKAVAMGGATKSFLNRKGIKRTIEPDDFDELGLLKAILATSIA